MKLILIYPRKQVIKAEPQAIRIAYLSGINFFRIGLSDFIFNGQNVSDKEWATFSP